MWPTLYIIDNMCHYTSSILPCDSRCFFCSQTKRAMQTVVKTNNPLPPKKKHREFVKLEIYLSFIHCNCHIMTSAKQLIAMWTTLFNIQTSMNLGGYLVPRGSAPMGMEVKPLSKNTRNYQEGSTPIYPLQ